MRSLGLLYSTLLSSRLVLRFGAQTILILFVSYLSRRYRHFRLVE